AAVQRPAAHAELGGDLLDAGIAGVEMQLDLLPDDADEIVAAGAALAAAHERLEEGEEVGIRIRHRRVEGALAKDDRVRRLREEHGGAEQRLVLAAFEGTRMFEVDLEWRPSPAVAVVEDVAEHAERELSVLAPAADATVGDLIVEIEQFALA